MDARPAGPQAVRGRHDGSDRTVRRRRHLQRDRHRRRSTDRCQSSASRLRFDLPARNTIPSLARPPIRPASASIGRFDVDRRGHDAARRCHCRRTSSRLAGEHVRHGRAYTATATDLVSGPLSPVCSPASGATFALGTTTVTCTVMDARGEPGDRQFLRDGPAPPPLPPVTLQLPGNLTALATGASGAVVTYSATASQGLLPVFPVCITR